MARANRSNSPTDQSPVVTIQRKVIEQCPVCGTLEPPEGSTMRTHIEAHAPTSKCRHCGVNDYAQLANVPTWKVDWDWVFYPRPDVGIFFCSRCGTFAPVKEG